MASHTPGALIFDMDGTLVDNMAFHTRSWLVLFKELGVEMTPSRLEVIMEANTTATLLRQELGADLTDGEVTRYGERKEDLYREIFRPHLKPVRGLEALLDRAQQRGIPLAVATSAGQRNIDFVLKGLGILNRFDVIVGGDDVPEGKGSPRIFMTTAQLLGVAPELCLVFEDSRSGIAAAHRAGMRVVVVATDGGARSFRNLPGAVDVIQDFADLDLDVWLTDQGTSTGESGH
jgi:HAD superfamily hydrolase (TIGR01509 family)